MRGGGNGVLLSLSYSPEGVAAWGFPESHGPHPTVSRLLPAAASLIGSSACANERRFCLKVGEAVRGALVGAAGGSISRSLLQMPQRATFILFRHGIASMFPRPWRQPLAPHISLNPAVTCQKFPGQGLPWSHQQIRTRARGNEYQPSNIKRKHKHGWIKRIRTASGIEVILRRMLKGRKSLSH